MKAVGLHQHLPIDHPQSLVDLELPEPRPGGRDLLVEMRAVSVNPVDTKRRAMKGPVENPPKILGYDAAGVVKALGPEAALFRPGDEVFYAGSVIRPGTNSELHLVDERIVGRKPRTLSFAEAAALPLTTLTAWELMFERMRISRTGEDAGRTMLILGGAGGVGSIAIQLAKQLSRLHVTASASRPESIAWARALGADATVDHSRPLGDAEYDFVLCLTSTDAYWTQFPKLLRPQGKLGLIVRATKPVDLSILHDKSIGIFLEGMFTRSTFRTPDMIAQHALLNEAASLVESGILRTTLQENLGRICAESLKRAHQRLEQGHAIGKLVLEGW
jgi:zinc-binding alcohol dehydrogenase family protein